MSAETIVRRALRNAGQPEHLIDQYIDQYTPNVMRIFNNYVEDGHTSEKAEQLLTEALRDGHEEALREAHRRVPKPEQIVEPEQIAEPQPTAKQAMLSPEDIHKKFSALKKPRRAFALFARDKRPSLEERGMSLGEIGTALRPAFLRATTSRLHPPVGLTLTRGAIFSDKKCKRSARQLSCNQPTSGLKTTPPRRAAGAMVE